MAFLDEKDSLYGDVKHIIKGRKKTTFFVSPLVLGEALMVWERKHPEEFVEKAAAAVKSFGEMIKSERFTIASMRGHERCFEFSNKILKTILEGGGTDYMDSFIVGLAVSDPEDRDVIIYTTDTYMQSNYQFQTLVTELRKEFNGTNVLFRSIK